MEISNKTIGVVCATIAVIAMCIRSQTTTVAAATGDTVNSQAMHLNPIQDSALPAAAPYRGPVVATSNLGTPNANLIRQNQAGEILHPGGSPPAPGVITDQKPVVSAPNTLASNSSSLSQSIVGNQGLGLSGNYSDPTYADSNNLADRQLLDMSTSYLNSNSKSAFDMTWSVMSDAERQDFINQLR